MWFLFAYYGCKQWKELCKWILNWNIINCSEGNITFQSTSVILKEESLPGILCSKAVSSLTESMIPTWTCSTDQLNCKKAWKSCIIWCCYSLSNINKTKTTNLVDVNVDFIHLLSNIWYHSTFSFQEFFAKYGLLRNISNL